ncbi:MAG: esterase/lipase family protein [Sediminibacterium sp.]
MKKKLSLLFSLCALITHAQNTYAPVVKSTAFDQPLSKNNSLVFTKAQAAKDAFLFLCGKDSSHLYFPNYRDHLEGLPNENSATYLEVWDVNYVRAANSISDTSQFILCTSNMLTPGLNVFNIHNAVLSNYHSTVNIESISFDEGTTWNNVTNNSISTIIPSNINWFSVAVKYSVNGAMKKTGIKFQVETKSLINPDTAPWQVSSSFEIDTLVGNKLVKGNAYTLLSYDGVFDKPFVFVEGIDFGNDHFASRNGTFGWDAFSSGAASGQYAMLQLMPYWIDTLQQHGYDLVLVDFYDGARDIRENAALVEKVINLCNTYKNSENSLVLAGASMGGLISRYALRNMELQNKPHCTRLYISLDAPHLGAYIPMSLQSAIYFMAPFSSAANSFVYDKLERPAAQQLLFYQWGASNQLQPTNFLSFQSELNAMGLPQNCRNIAIANGNKNGIGLSSNISEPLLTESCNASNLFGGDEFRLKFFPLPGSNDYVENTSTHRVIADLKLTEVDTDFLSLSISQYSSRPKISVSALPFDYSCGGFSSSVKDFVDAINETASFNSACGTINNDQFELYHNFVPTTSALHCSVNEPFTAINGIEIPFDNWYAPSGNNQPHSGINYANLAFLAQEVFADELPNGHSVFRLNMENGENFNFGKTGLQVLPSTIIENNSVVSIGALGESNSSLNSIVFPGDEINIETGIDCGQGSIDIREGGSLQIGDAAGTVNASLHVQETTTINLQDNGTLFIHPNGQLILENNSTLNLLGGTLQVEGKIVLLPGGKIVFSSGEVVLNNTDACIEFRGGQIQVNPQADFHVQAIQGGLDIYSSWNETDVIFASGSRMHVEGIDSENTLLRIHEGAMFNESGTANYIRFENGKIELQENATLLSYQRLHFNNTEITAAENALCQVDYNSLSFLNSSSNNCRIKSNYGKLSAVNCDFVNNNAISVRYGNYTFEECIFNASNLFSEHLKSLSRIKNTSFENNDVAVSDYSLVEIGITNCTFNNNNIAAQKKGGVFTIRCSEFSQNGTALEIGKGCVLNLSSSSAGGYNSFTSNNEHIHFYHSSTPLLNKGFNSFTSAHDCNLCGNIATISSVNCATVALASSQNEWLPIASGSNGIALYTSSTCSNGNQGAITLSPSVEVSVQCPSVIGILSPTKSLAQASLQQKTLSDLPLISTTEYGQLPLDSALSLAATLAYATDSLFEGKRSIKLFHEILTSSLDRNNSEIRSLSNWGIGMMKKMIEELILRGEIIPENNSESFEIAVQRYVNALNACTDSTVSDSSFHSQFWIELSKAQLFRSLGNSNLCHAILDQLNTCNIEGEELEELLYWKALTAQELNNTTALISNVNDSIFTSLSNSNFPFGIEILGPQEVLFYSCFSDNKNLNPSSGKIVPSINAGEFKLQFTKKNNLVKWKLLSAVGQLIHEGNARECSEIPFSFELTNGCYFLQYSLDNGSIQTEKFVIEN